MEVLEDIKENPPVQTQQVTTKSEISGLGQIYPQGYHLNIPILLKIIRDSQSSSSFKEEISAFQKKVRNDRYVTVRVTKSDFTTLLIK